MMNNLHIGPHPRRPTLTVVFVSCVLTFSVSASRAADADSADDPQPLRVMTYNLRYASDTPPNSWGERLPVAVAMLEATAPDVIGTQEGLYRQIKDLDAALPDYAWIGIGREGGSHGEFMAVFYRRERFEPVEFDYYWLSDTPEVVASATWGNTSIRMVTWVRFRDRIAGNEFYVLDTHLDNAVRDAREKSAQLIVQRTARLDPNLPVVLLGDFNSRAEKSQVYDTLVADGAFADAWNAAAQRGEPIDTFHDYEQVGDSGRRIDWILTRGPVQVRSAAVVTFSQDGQFPSDHFPVMADVVIDTSVE
ncbi:MAG: endonuclease/exonuclease/phosphatase family protein [Planctomycetales bacterium]|nr:endonuclease/exonuclease/phosphatase family protein [Planctomycetales bacterium]